MRLHSSPLLAAAVLGFALSSLVACNATMPQIPGLSKKSAAEVDPDARPDWINNPGDGVSASAGTHVKGRVAQEELAIQRAREELAKRKGVSIESEQVSAQMVANGRANTTGQKVTHEVTNQSEVKGQIKAKWRDPNSDVFWVWLVPSGS